MSKSSTDVKLRVCILIFISIVLLFGYFALSFLSSKISLVSQTTMILQNGVPVSKDILDYPMQKKIFDVIANLCISGLISILISVLITTTLEKQERIRQEREMDENARQKQLQIDLLNEKINEDVFNAVLKKLVPDKIFRLINEQIFKTKAVRKDAHWFFTFTENKSGSLDLSQQLIFQLQNVSLETIYDPIKTYSDNKEYLDMDSVSVIIDDKQVLLFDAKKEYKINSSGKPVCRNKQVCIEKEPEGYYLVTVNIEIPAQKTANFKIEYHDHFETDYVRDGYFTRYPITDALLQMTYPENWTIDVFYPIKPHMNIIENTNGKYTVNIDGGLLPGQGFIYTLRKKKVVNSTTKCNS